MKIRNQFFLISSVLMFLVFFYSYYSFHKNYNLIIKNYQLEAVELASNIRFNTSSIVDEIVLKIHTQKDLHTKIYYTIAKRIAENPNINLEDIKREYDKKYPDRAFNFYLFNKDFVIYKTTYQPDLGLDFKILGEQIFALLTSVYKREKTIDISDVFTEEYSGKYLRYYIHRPKGVDFMVQMSVIFKQNELLNDYYKTIVNENADLLDITIFALAKTYLNAYTLKGKIDEKKNVKKPGYGREKFSSLYEHFFHQQLPENTKKIDQNIKSALKKNGGYLSVTEKLKDKFYQTILIPISNYQTLQDKEVISNFIVLKFDITRQVEEIKSYKRDNIIFNSILFLIVVSLLFVLYRKVLAPVRLLSEKMSRREVSTIKKKKDEVSLMINGYNELLQELSSEIELNKELSLIDPLTRAYNRQAYEKEIEAALTKLNISNTSFSVISFDIDDFKKINDTYGHLVGDKVLKELSRLVKTIIKENDKLFRMGGEEFLILCGDTTVNRALEFAESLRELIEEKLMVVTNERITISIGVTQAKHSDKEDSLYKRVDDCLYSSKKAGKNRVTSA